jgi:acetolactate synthase-1/2/3 large subunit
VTSVVLDTNALMMPVECDVRLFEEAERLLGDVEYSKFAEMLGGYGEEVRDPNEIQSALQRARESVQKTGKCAVVNIWVDPKEYAPGTKAQTMYK